MQASVCLAFTFEFRVLVHRSGMSCLYKFENACVGEMLLVIFPVLRLGVQRNKSIVPYRLKDRDS